MHYVYNEVILLLALASSGILLPSASGWHLLREGTSLTESAWGGTPFPVPIGRIRRVVLSTGFRGSADRSVVSAAGAVSCAVLAPASQPLALG